MLFLAPRLLGRVSLAMLATICTVGPAIYAENSPSRIFFTDLLSGPATGGEGDEGAFVTLYGTGFGEQRGDSTVTIGGVPVHSYPRWTDTRISVQLGRGAHSGEFVVLIAGHATSSGQSFNVRPGRIFFVSPEGDDRNSGTVNKPWKTLIAANTSLRPGDIAYVKEGVEQITEDKYESALSIQTSGREGEPIALVAYPGAKVVIGSFDSPRIAMRTPNIDRSSDHWVLAGLTFHGAMEALDVTASSDWRIVGNEFSCPKGFGPSGCVEIAQAAHVAFLGNSIHDIAQPRTTKMYHAVYFTTDSNHIEVAWNVIADVRGCRGLQFHSSPLDRGTGMNLYDLKVHDNIIHNVVCDGINFATIDPSKGMVAAYNNLIYNVGTGPDPEDGGANYACIYVQGGANAGDPGTGTVEIYNNTFYHCGTRGNTDSGAISLSGGSPAQQVRLKRNIIVLSAGIPLLSPNSNKLSPLYSGNIVWSPKASFLPSHTEIQFRVVDPLFNNAARGDFTLRNGSPALGLGAPPTLSWDLRDLMGVAAPPNAKPR